MKYTSHQSLWGKTKEVGLRTLIPLLTTALSILAIDSLAEDHDTITLKNWKSGETALWVSETNNGSIESKLLKGNTSQFISTFTGESGAIIAYAYDRPPTLKPRSWTSGIDTVTMKLDNIHRIGLTVWVINVGNNEDFEKMKQTVALEAGSRTSEIWLNERQGIEFGSFDVKDATQVADSDGLLISDKLRREPFHCGMSSLLKRAGFTPNMINVYYVETVGVGNVASDTSGEYCAPDLIALGAGSDNALLAHELGHAFALPHTYDTPRHFDKTNVMHPKSGIRNSLTEGQTFRAIAHQGSAINFLYNTRVNSPKIKCDPTFKLTEPDCPPIQQRIWRDEGENGMSWDPDNEGAPPPIARLAPDMEALQAYLDLDCEDLLERADKKRESLQALPKVMEFKKDLEPEFIRLLAKGLDDQALQERTRFLEAQWERREAFLKKKPNLGLKKDDLMILQATTKRTYLNQGREQLIQRHQEKAIGALLAIDTPTAIQALSSFRAKTGNRVLKDILDRRLPGESPVPTEVKPPRDDAAPEAPAALKVF